MDRLNLLGHPDEELSGLHAVSDTCVEPVRSFYRFREPPSAAHFEPAEMTTQGCRAEYSIWCLFDLFVGQGFSYSDLIPKV